MTDKLLFRTGIAGTVLAALCCMAPGLAIVLGATGAAVWLGWLEYALLPVLALSFAAFALAMWLRRRGATVAASDQAGP